MNKINSHSSTRPKQKKLKSSPSQLQPKPGEAFKKYLFSAEKKVQKNSKLMKPYYDGMQRSRKRLKSDRGSSSSVLSQGKGTQRVKKSLGRSMTRKYLPKPKVKPQQKKLNLNNLVSNRRREKISRNSESFKSASKSREDSRATKRKDSQKHNVMPMEMFNRNIKINPNFQKYIANKMPKKLILKPDSPKIISVKDTKHSVVPTRNRANLNQYLSNIHRSGEKSEKRKSLVMSRESYLSNPQQPNSNISQRPKFPMPPGQALKLFSREMNDFETSEILDYKMIYYLGQNAEKVKGSILKKPNYGYDDENGDYKVILNDHIAYRYQITDY